jgi:hypothetical protein
VAGKLAEKIMSPSVSKTCPDGSQGVPVHRDVPVQRDVPVHRDVQVQRDVPVQTMIELNVTDQPTLLISKQNTEIINQEVRMFQPMSVILKQILY